MARQFKDYDALAAEKEPIRFRAAGKDYELPAELPARLMLDAHRMSKKGIKDDEADEFGMRILSRIFPDDEWDRLVDNMGQDTLGKLTADLMAVYFGGDDEDPKVGETGESPSTTSSSTSEPSTPTSNGSTPEVSTPSTAPSETPASSPGNGSVSELPISQKVQASS